MRICPTRKVVRQICLEQIWTLQPRSNVPKGEGQDVRNTPARGTISIYSDNFNIANHPSLATRLLVNNC